jgi:hypothetical protein
LPEASLRAHRYTTGTYTDTTVAYSWADEATYESASGIVLTTTPASPILIDPTDYAYELCVATEWGSNAFANTILVGIQANVTVDTAEGGADFKFW